MNRFWVQFPVQLNGKGMSEQRGEFGIWSWPAAKRPPDPGQLRLKNALGSRRRGFMAQIHRNSAVFGAKFPILVWLSGESCF